MDKLLLTILFLLILSPSILASYQTPEVLIYKGKIYDLQSNPLEAYYADKSPRFLIDPYYESSGNSRGYVATWEVIDEKLYLSKIDSWFCNKSIRTKSGCRRVTLKDLFGKKVVNGKVSASWFSGQLEVTDGETIPCASEPGLPIFEREIIFEVDAGKIGEPSIIDNLKRLDLYKRCSRQQRKPS